MPASRARRPPRLAVVALAPEDLELCYPGDGSCGSVPLLGPRCVLGDCLLGRWTFTCERQGSNLAGSGTGSPVLDSRFLVASFDCLATLPWKTGWQPVLMPVGATGNRAYASQTGVLP